MGAGLQYHFGTVDSEGFSARVWGRVFALSNLPRYRQDAVFYPTVSCMEACQASLNRVARICCSLLGATARLPVWLCAGLLPVGLLLLPASPPTLPSAFAFLLQAAGTLRACEHRPPACSRSWFLLLRVYGSAFLPTVCRRCGCAGLVYTA